MAEEKKPKLAPRRAKALENLSVCVPHDDEGDKRYPMISDLLRPLYDGNVCTREPASISIRVEGSCYKVSVYAPWEGVQTSVTLDTLIDLMGKLEKFLSSGKTPWSPTNDARKNSLKGVDRIIQ